MLNSQALRTGLQKFDHTTAMVIFTSLLFAHSWLVLRLLYISVSVCLFVCLHLSHAHHTHNNYVMNIIAHATLLWLTYGYWYSLVTQLLRVTSSKSRKWPG